jgi:hypothetical protein
VTLATVAIVTGACVAALQCVGLRVVLIDCGEKKGEAEGCGVEEVLALLEARTRRD